MALSRVPDSLVTESQAIYKFLTEARLTITASWPGTLAARVAGSMTQMRVFEVIDSILQKLVDDPD